MDAADSIRRKAWAAGIAQRLAEPARAILGYQELVVEEVRENGPIEALPDLERVLTAAQGLNDFIQVLLSDGVAAEEAEVTQSRLRHDFRTPLNAVLGYSEMVMEEFADDLPEQLTADIDLILRESRALLGQIDTILEFSMLHELKADDELEASIASELARTIAARPRTVVEAGGRILVVDDVATNRDLLARRLAREGHEPAVAASGLEALELLAECPFELVLADILMPDMNGIELLRRIKSDERFREIPVVMISGLKEDEAVIRCIEAGAEDYLPKPIDPVLLRARISACLERRRWQEREREYLAQIEFEKERADSLLHAVLPGQVIDRLSAGETVIADRFEEATILFADIVGFSPLAARTAPAALLQRLGALFSRFDELADQHGVEKIKTIGDAYMAAAGLPEPRRDHASAALAFARALLAEIDRQAVDDPNPLNIRIGINSGPVVAGLIGRKRFVYDVWGHTVNLASRLESHGYPGRIHMSGSTLAALDEPPRMVCQADVDIKGMGQVTTFLLP